MDSIVVGALQVNCYFLGCEETREAVVIDPGDQANDVLRVLTKHQWRLTQIVNTHAHFDHIMGVRDLKAATGMPFYLHQADLPYVADMRQRVMLWLGFDP
ncbi:MAG: MBL fold metallo-hydrolase, partial [Anaerolineae bacterium]